MILDGKIIACDRCKEPAISVKGEVIDLWYSGKAHTHGGTIQAVTAPDWLPLWVSEAEPGSVHDITAARLHALPALYRAAAGGLPPWPTPAMRVRAWASSSRSSSRPAAGNSTSIPEPQRDPAVPALPRRTRVRAAHRLLAHPPAHHRQPQQDRRHRPRRPRPHPFRARLHHMNFTEITSVLREHCSATLDGHCCYFRHPN